MLSVYTATPDFLACELRPSNTSEGDPVSICFTCWMRRQCHCVTTHPRGWLQASNERGGASRSHLLCCGEVVRGGQLWWDSPCPHMCRCRFAPRGELSYFAPLGSENISAPYFKQCFFLGGGVITPQTVKHHAFQSQDRNNKYFILYIEFCINNKI